MFATVAETVAAIIVLAAPPELEPVRLHDLTRFPALAVVESYRPMIEAHHTRCWRGWHETPTPADGLWLSLAHEADHTRRAWRLLADALDDTQRDCDRLEWLELLRDHLGAADYFAGRLPDPIPVHRLQWRD